MAFFKDLGKKITEGVQDASEKASELLEVTKLNAEISKEKGAIDEAKKQIGDKVLAMYKAGENLPPTLADELNIIDSHLKTIAGIEAKIREVKGEPAAQQSDTLVPTPPTAPAAGEPGAAAAKFCANCGAKLAEGTAFCGECGQKVS